MARQLKDKKKSGLGGLFSNDAREKTRASRSAEQAEKRSSRAADRAISRVKGNNNTKEEEKSFQAPDTINVYGHTVTLTQDQKTAWENAVMRPEDKGRSEKAGTYKAGTGSAKNLSTSKKGGMSKEKARAYRTKFLDNKDTRVKEPTYAEMKDRKSVV